MNFYTDELIKNSFADKNMSFNHAPVFKQIFILDRIEYRILFALAKLTELNNEYYWCCAIYSNNF